MECVSIKVMLLFFTRIRYLATLRRAKSSVPIIYYDNHVASHHLLISLSDSKLNPEPTPRCQKCSKTIRRNQIQHKCMTCFETSHTKHISKVRHQGLQHFWICHNFAVRELTFFNVKLEELNTTLIEDIVDKYINALVRSSHLEIFCEKGVLRNFANFTGKPCARDFY